MNVRVGILDTGIKAPGVVATAYFIEQDQSNLFAPPETEHGSQLAFIVRANAPLADLLDARVNLANQSSSPEQIAAAIDWLVQEKADIISISLMLRTDHNVLAEAIVRAQRAGVVCVASMPAQGTSAYPAHYPSVVTVADDARCSAGEFSLLQSGPEWQFGAAGGGPNHRAHQRGHCRHLSCAHVSGTLAHLLQTGVPAASLLQTFAKHCYWLERAA